MLNPVRKICVSSLVKKKGKRMKRTLLALAVLGIVAQSGLAQADPYTKGNIWENTIVPLDAAKPEMNDREGEATCKNVLNMVQWGECGVAQAMQNGKIQKVNHVDVHREGSIFFKKVTTKVYGK